MRKVRFVAVALAVLGVGGAALAAEGGRPVTREEYETLERRLAELESDRRPGEKDTAAAWMKRVQFQGLMELEAFYRRTVPRPGLSTHDSDVRLATVQLGLGAELVPWARADVVFLWEEDDNERVIVDQGYLTVKDLNRLPLYLIAGRQYVPFGPCDVRHLHCPWAASYSHFITDPVALEIAQTRETALRCGAVWGPFDVSLSAWNGDVSKAGRTRGDRVDNISAAVSAHHDFGDVAFALGAAWVSNIADSDGLGDEAANSAAGAVRRDVPGANAWANVRCRRLHLLAEYVGATTPFQPDELRYAGAARSRPRAVNAEAAVEVADRLTMAAKAERAWDVSNWQPKRRCGVCGWYQLFKTDVASGRMGLEYLREAFGNRDQADVVTARLVIEF